MKKGWAQRLMAVWGEAGGAPELTPWDERYCKPTVSVENLVQATLLLASRGEPSDELLIRIRNQASALRHKAHSERALGVLVPTLVGKDREAAEGLVATFRVVHATENQSLIADADGPQGEVHFHLGPRGRSLCIRQSFLLAGDERELRALFVVRFPPGREGEKRAHQRVELDGYSYFDPVLPVIFGALPAALVPTEATQRRLLLRMLYPWGLNLSSQYHDDEGTAAFFRVADWLFSVPGDQTRERQQQQFDTLCCDPGDRRVDPHPFYLG